MLSPGYNGYKNETCSQQNDHMEGMSSVTIDPSGDLQADYSTLLREFNRDHKQLERLLQLEKRRASSPLILQ
jgi:hypothetical protein